MTEMTLKKSPCQRLRSDIEGYRNLVNSIALKPLNVFEPKPTQIFLTVGPRANYVFKVMGSKIKVTETFSGGGISMDTLHWTQYLSGRI